MNTTTTSFLLHKAVQQKLHNAARYLVDRAGGPLSVMDMEAVSILRMAQDGETDFGRAMELMGWFEAGARETPTAYLHRPLYRDSQSN